MIAKFLRASARRFLVVVGGVIAVIALTFGVAAPASADPSYPPFGPGNPEIFRALPGGGSDTTQDLTNGLASVVSVDNQLVLASYDATIPDGDDNFIQTTPTGPLIPRPNGSGEGLRALSTAVDAPNTPRTLTNSRGTSSAPLGYDAFKFSRSSSGPANDPTGALVYIPSAIDAVTYATSPNSLIPADLRLGTVAPNPGTFAEPVDLNLRNIYQHDGSYLRDGGAPNQIYYVGDLTQAQLNATHGAGTVVKIHPYTPQQGSGTRQFWNGQVGINNTTLTPGTTRDAFTDVLNEVVSVQEHDGSVVDPDQNPVANQAIVPFSIAQWVAQQNRVVLESEYGTVVNDRRHGAVLRAINGQPALDGGVLNDEFPVQRFVYNVVEYAAVADSAADEYDEYLARVFVGENGALYNVPGAVTANVISDFGFGVIPDGGVSIDGSPVYERGGLYSTLRADLTF